MEEEMAPAGSSHPRTFLLALFGYDRMVKACLLAVAILTISTLNTSASIGWCRSDPVLQIDDSLADVFVSIPIESVPQVTGPTQFIITTPVGIDSAVLLTTVGFGHGETATIQQSPALKVINGWIQLRIKAYVPATSGTIPVIVEFAPRVVGILAPASAKGMTNQWITLTTSI
jgi:hypothetical protein